MIAVVADDLTGAAELGGLGLKYQLQVELDTVVNPLSRADLLVIATDTRSKSQDEAEAEMKKVSEELKQLNPQLIFKKIDSALRGHILPEIRVQLPALNLQRALIVPANPLLGRTISDGIYYLHENPIHLSSFSKDPEFAITTSRVKDMLGGNDRVQVLKNDQSIPGTGIIIGEAATAADLKAWTAHINKGTLIAGAAGFFSAILDTIAVQSESEPDNAMVKLSTPALYICGSTFHKSVQAIENEKRKGGPVSYMPREIALKQEPEESWYEKWANEVLLNIQDHGKAIIAISPETAGTHVSAAALREKTARVVAKIFRKATIPELFIEGGSTASAVLRGLGIKKLFPLKELAPGVIRMRADINKNLHLTLKPGSYDWPPGIWDFMNT